MNGSQGLNYKQLFDDMKEKIKNYRFRNSYGDEEDMGEILNAVEVAKADEKQKKRVLSHFTIERR